MRRRRGSAWRSRPSSARLDRASPEPAPNLATIRSKWWTQPVFAFMPKGENAMQRAPAGAAPRMRPSAASVAA